MLANASSTPPYKVLFINDTPRNGGPGRSLCTLLRHLDKRLVHRTVLLPRPGPIEELLRELDAAEEIRFEPQWVENPVAPWGRAMEREDFDVPFLTKGLRAAVNMVRMTRALLKLRATVKAERFDLVYCNGTTADFMGGLLAFFCEIPTVWHVRYTSIPLLARPLHRLLARSHSLKRIVCVSGAAASQFPFCSGKVSVVHNGVEVDDFEPAAVEGCLRRELGLSSDVVIFGSHGRLVRRKGFVEMLRAAQKALELLEPEERPRCHFSIVGDTPADFSEDHLETCRTLAQELGIAEHVSFLGFKADVRPYVKDFDVAVVPSVYPDPLPRAVIESMALGKPVIAFDVGGVAEMLTPREGALVQGLPPDVEGLARQYVHYFRHPDLRRRQGEAARKRVLHQFGARGHAKAIGDIITRAISEESTLVTGTVTV